MDPRASFKRIALSPWMALGLCFLILTARWIWIVGMGDYGWGFEIAHRIAHGEVPYRDFILTAGPLAFYGLGTLFALMGESIWLYHIYLYGWWLVTLVGGLLITQQLHLERKVAFAAIALAASASYPASSLGHLYNYVAAALGGLSIFFLLRFHSSFKGSDLFLSALLLGLVVLAKQNVGLVLSAASGFSLWVWRSSLRERSLSLHPFLLGWSLGFFPFLLLLGIQVGLGEVTRQLFWDSFVLKGSGTKLLFSWLPHLVWPTNAAYRYFLEAGLTLPVFLFMVWLCRVKPHSLSEESTLARPPFQGASTLCFSTLVVIFFLSLVFLSAISCLDLPRLRSLLQSHRLYPSGDLFRLSMQLAYLWTFTSCVVTLVRNKLDFGHREVLVAVLCLGLTLGYVVTSLDNFFLSLPVVAPLVLALPASLTPRWSKACTTLLLALGVCLAAHFGAQGKVGVSFSPAFVRLVRLPGGSPFSGFYSSPDWGSFIEVMWTHVAPRIQGHRTLWLMWAGPHAVWDGRSVRNVGCLFSDTYHPRNERSLMEDWRQHPPDFIVLGPFSRPVGSTWFQEENLLSWLEGSYVKVWSSGSYSLWEIKAPVF